MYINMYIYICIHIHIILPTLDEQALGRLVGGYRLSIRLSLFGRYPHNENKPWFMNPGWTL